MLQSPHPPAPPPVYAPGGLSASVLDGLPIIMQDAQRFRVLGLRVTGSPDLLASASAKLKAERWPAPVTRLPSGETVMIVDAKGRALVDVQAVLGRFQHGEFGAVTASVAALPDSSSK